MNYFNKVTKQVLDLSELCRQENASIAAGLAYGQWLPVVADEFPSEQVEGSHYETGTIVEDGDVARLPWVLVPNPVIPEEPAPAEPV